MYKWFFGLALAFGIIDDFILDSSLNTAIKSFAKDHYYWGIWILVFLTYLIGDYVVKELKEANEKLENIQSNLETSAENLGKQLDKLIDRTIIDNGKLLYSSDKVVHRLEQLEHTMSPKGIKFD